MFGFVFVFLLLGEKTNKKENSNNYLAFIGLIAPIFEAYIGIMLLVKKYRKLGIYCAAFMHIFALINLGPLGHNWNHIVWPWNFSMMLMVFIVFTKNEKDFREFFKKDFLIITSFLLFFIIPVLNFKGLYDNHLSFSLYSGIKPTSSIKLDDKEFKKLPKEISNFYNKDKQSFNTSLWYVKSTNMAVLPEVRYHRHIIKSLCKNFSIKNSTLITKYKPRFSTTYTKEETPCNI